MAVNHVAPFLLTLRLREALLASAPARVVWVSSVAHRRGKVDPADLMISEGWQHYRAYAASKLANVLTSNALARRLAGTGVTSVALHPGVVGTKLLRTGFDMSGIDPADGARTSVWAVTAPELAVVTGAYLDDQAVSQPAPAALDVELQEQVWAATEALLGEAWPA
jgi:NAD(P)-dependent dehydrogenase (short-subunit alcohol dehydrogenase family)